MIKTTILSSGLVAALALAAAAQSPRVLFVRCGTLVYDTQKPPLRDADVVITDGKITAVATGLTAPPGAATLDLSTQTVMPSLLDAHTHLATGGRGEGASNASDALASLLASRDVAYAVNSGVAAMRVLGTSGFIDVALENAIDAGVIPGPHMIPAGYALTIPAGHGDHYTFPDTMPLDDYYIPLHGFINSDADAEKAVHLQVKYGAKVIKIFASGGVGSPLDLFTSEQLTPEEMQKIVEVAHGDHLKVAAHDENLKAILDALHAGVDSIEHGSELNQEAVDYMKAHHQVLDATLYVVDNILQNGEQDHLPAYEMEKARELAPSHFSSFQLALRSGVTMAAGSDQSYAPGTGTIYNEMVSEVAHGATPAQALTAATQTNAALLDLSQLGTIAVGKEGDLVAMPGNPLDDIHALAHLTAIVYQGRVLKAPAAR